SEVELSKLFAYSYASSLKLENPLAQDQTHLRPSLLLGLFDNLRYNISRGNAPVPLFETGKTFKDSGGKVFEMVSVAFAIYLPNEVESWRSETQPDYYSARRWIEE